MYRNSYQHKHLLYQNHMLYLLMHCHLEILMDLRLSQNHLQLFLIYSQFHVSHILSCLILVQIIHGLLQIDYLSLYHPCHTMFFSLLYLYHRNIHDLLLHTFLSILMKDNRQYLHLQHIHEHLQKVK